MSRVQVRLLPNGRVEVETAGIKGPVCEELALRLATILRAEVASSRRTPEFYEGVSNQTNWVVQTDDQSDGT